MFDPETGLLPWHVELFYDNAWNDIVGDVNVGDGLRITRGRDDYESEMPPSRCSLTLDNSEGKYSPKNPLSPLYGKLARNTPLRVRLGDPDAVIDFGSAPAAYVSTPDPGSELSPAGRFEVRVELGRDVEPTANERAIAAKGDDATGRSWVLILRPDGRIRFLWKAETDGSFRWAESFATVGPRVRAFRFVFSPDGDDTWSESAGHPTVVKYHAETLDDPWTYGNTTAWLSMPPTSNVSSTGPLGVGADGGGGRPFGAPSIDGTVESLQVIGPTEDDVRADSGFRGGEQATTWTDGTGREWTVHGDPAWTDRSVRFNGEVRAWPQRWGQPDGSDAEVRLEAIGLRSRISRTTAPLRSPMFRASTSPGEMPRTIAYWPMEEPSGATEFASGIGGPPMLIGRIPGYHVRDIRPGAYDGFRGSEAVAEFNVTSAVANVPPVPPTGELRTFCLVHLPENGVPQVNGADAVVSLLNLRTTGSASEWSLQISSNGAARVVAWSRTGATLLESGWAWAAPGSTSANGRHLLGGLWLRQEGADVRWQWFFFHEGGQAAGVVDGVLTGHSFGSASSVVIGASGDLGGTAVGHLSVHNVNTGSLWGTILDGFNANGPETATARIARLANEEAVPFIAPTGSDDSEPVGYQKTGALLDLMEEAAEADLGLLLEDRGTSALRYVPRAHLYNRVPLVIDYQDVVAPFEPTDDDVAIANDVTVSREDGASFRAVLEDGPLSVQAPPVGIGRYDDSVQLSLWEDPQVVHQAGWRLHLGTVDETRYPQLSVDLHGAPHLVDTVPRLDVASRVQVTNLPKWLPPDRADLLVQGYTEETDGLTWRLVFNCTPASAWTVGVADDATYGRADTSGSALLEPASAEDTQLAVLTTNGPRWVQDSDRAGQFPLDVKFGGEIATVTGIRPLLSDSFARGDAGLWDVDTWDETFVWGE
ncbi:hypothetical protein [Prauserella muralis]|uniref:Uncharacterized protein n=1 Tax=Prauserella muralis TaxID=588067 RepID=A0A2V4AKS1_9PSEU|nr:hypothetical protein [Prauserella muralis]PXY20875.1 hypothetical protein BAY60_25565 [Prauserella muralis]TWE29915.1 hypothetical protein FHX69_2608 [Prauserella muralis]